ncbi:MAG: sugar ABC transporter ATP-binding protein [Sphaerochaeta sp.]|nr:sugar ABC transporter ATP-binding protein [Sphaerochaeta sp.]
MSDVFIQFTNLSKRFGGIQALDQVSFSIKKGKILGLMGENGAGKSTLMRILCGIQTCSEGEIFVEGKNVSLASPQEAQDLGIGMIPQELLLVHCMTVAENMFLGYEIRDSLGFVDAKAMEKKTGEVLAELGCEGVDPSDILGTISKANQQMVAIGRRIIQGGKLFIMDEPTSALTVHETEKLFSVVRNLCKKGKAIVFISHRLEEVLELCDYFAILRDGKLVDMFDNGPEITKQSLIKPMIGSILDEEYPHEKTEFGDVLFSCTDLSYKKDNEELVHDISFDLHAGEVVGFSGLVGMGKSELAQALYGLRPLIKGSVKFHGKELKGHNPIESSRRGLAFVTEDRRSEGLILGLKSLFNMTLKCLPKVSVASVIDSKKEKSIGMGYVKQMNMKIQYLDLPANSLSGGNQQKVVVARQLASDSEVIIFDEPTKGIDVLAKAEMAKIINTLSKQKKGILIFSSEPREVLGLCDSLYVLNLNGLQGPYMRGELDYQSLMGIQFGESNE